MQSSVNTLPLIALAARVSRGVILGLFAATLLLASFTMAHAASLTLTWTDASTNEDGFHIQRKTGTGGIYATLATVTAGTTGYVDGTVTVGTTYCYHVSAYNAAGDSAFSNEACATPASQTPVRITAAKTGTGSGTVTSIPTGINCGSTCYADLSYGTNVTLTAAAATGSTFTGWSGGGCNGTGACTFAVNTATTVTATFALQTSTLTVTKAGTGAGTVSSAPAGITCGGTCSASFTNGTSVTLTAAATTGATFTGWSGACSGTDACTVSMTAARSVTATFTTSGASTYTLTVGKSGSGSGTVTSSPSGVNCGGTCNASFSSGSNVTLTAAAATGSTFAGWSGAGCSGTGTCTVTMSSAQGVTAAFGVQTFALTVAKAGTGSGTVTSTSGAINCGSTCGASIASGTAVTLTASAASGSVFTGWSGACAGTGATSTVTVDAAKSVTATFAANPASTYTLSVMKSGTGTGIVASNPAGINCGTMCSASYPNSYPNGAVVTLQALPDAGSTFAGWSGACTGTGACTVTLNQAQSVTAAFSLQRVTLTVTKAGTGFGTVKSTPTGINCGWTCSANFNSGTSVTLTAKAGWRSKFAGWSGACSGTGTCTVPITQAKSVTATFTWHH